mmetsp:Transcript_75179/g.230012  ORF Transcript_75179/g.230012 Transcript_75179/m.230012 type:complete len:201 (-) Transcript_75179:19-621(-)
MSTTSSTDRTARMKGQSMSAAPKSSPNWQIAKVHTQIAVLELKRLSAASLSTAAIKSLKRPPHQWLNMMFAGCCRLDTNSTQLYQRRFGSRGSRSPSGSTNGITFFKTSSVNWYKLIVCQLITFPCVPSPFEKSVVFLRSSVLVNRWTKVLSSRNCLMVMARCTTSGIRARSSAKPHGSGMVLTTQGGACATEQRASNPD